MPKFNTPDERQIDVVIGNRIRQARMMEKMSQTDLAKALGITFQQVQKYETGRNRVSAGRLLQIANQLGHSPLWFYGETILPPRAKSQGPDVRDQFFSLPYASEIAADYVRIRRSAARNVVASVVREIAGRELSPSEHSRAARRVA